MVSNHEAHECNFFGIIYLVESSGIYNEFYHTSRYIEEKY